MKSLRCVLGLHDWCVVLPGERTINYRGKNWWPMSGFDSFVCRRCDKPRTGQLLLPAGWDGNMIRVGRTTELDEELEEKHMYCNKCGVELLPWEKERFKEGGMCFHCFVEEQT